MWQRYSINDFRTITHYLGAIVSLSGLVMLLPVLVGLIFQEWGASARYLLSAGIAFVVGGAMRLVRISPGRMTRQQALAVTGFSWIVVSFIGAIPLFLSAHYSVYTDALFDSVSAFTTTNATMISDLDHISNADNMWRFVMTYSGGLGLIVVAVSLGLFDGMAGSSMYSSEGRSDHVLPNILQTTRFIFKFTLSVTLASGAILGVILIFRGLPTFVSFFHGVWLAGTSLMTAGSSPMSTGISYYHSIGVEVVLMVLMIFGSINFALQSEVLAGRSHFFFKNSEIHTGLIWWLIMLAVFIAVLCGSQLASGLPFLMRSGLFSFVSAATTSGFTSMTSSQVNAIFPSGAILLLTLVMAVGGSTGSTAGGIKLQRITIIVKAAIETVKYTASADSIKLSTEYNHIGRHRLEVGEIRDAMTVTIIFIVMIIIGAMAGIAFGFDAMTALTESVAMASTSGISAGITQAGMPMFLKTVYITEMWMGRLESVTLIALTAKIIFSIRLPRRKRG